MFETFSSGGAQTSAQGLLDYRHSMTPSLEKRFLKHVPSRPANPTTTCMEWTGVRDDVGRGRIQGRVSEGREKFIASRLAWEHAYGPIPEGLWVLHRCDNPSCVNPLHLFLGTHTDNMVDRSQKERQPRGESHGWHRLTNDRVARMRTLRRQGLNLKTLAAMFHVSLPTVSLVVRKRTWRHVT